MQQYSQLVEFINMFSYIWPKYITKQLKKETTLELLHNIMIFTSKQPGETVLLFLAVLRYISDDHILSTFEKSDSFDTFIKHNQEKIVHFSKTRNVQANLPSRALPIAELIAKIIPATRVGVIELGASFGLLGDCLLNMNSVIDTSPKYFASAQQLPKDYIQITHYTGIEINPPDEAWLLACLSEHENKNLLINFINDFHKKNPPEIIKRSAFDFSQGDMIGRMLAEVDAIVILTSYMLYQLDEKDRRRLENEINNCVSKYAQCYWINQTVNTNGTTKENTFYIECNGHKYIDLPDDTCVSWKWM